MTYVADIFCILPKCQKYALCGDVNMIARVQAIDISWIIILLILCMRCTWICAEINAEINFDVEGNGFHRL